MNRLIRSCGRACLASIVACLITLPSSAVVAADEASFAPLAAEYDQGIRPLLKQFCLDCHSTASQEGELDLERFSSLADVRSEPKAWLKVIEMLDNGEMPPQDSPQLDAGQHDLLRGWARRYLDAEALASAGDPGPVVLRRLSNVEYNLTVRDLTGVDLQPAREFPADGAAGEGFTNVGDALVMSPAMLDKYLDAAKGIAAHAVLLPHGFRFSPQATPADWTNELIARIKQLYARYTDPEGSTRVNLQGLQWETNAGGRLPLEPYLAATIAHREALTAGTTTIEAVAAGESLSPKYLRILWDTLHAQDDSLLVKQVREQWRVAGPDDVAALAAGIRGWQMALTTFKSVGHFKPWQEPVNPVVGGQNFRLKLDASTTPDNAGSSDIVLRLAARAAGETDDNNLVVWQQPRFERAGRAPLPLRDVRPALRRLLADREKLVQSSRYLAVAGDARGSQEPIDIGLLAKEHHLDARLLAAWFSYLGIEDATGPSIDTLFTEQMNSGNGYDFIQAWGVPATPSVTANSSDQEVRVPGIMKPHSVAVHPSPTQAVAVGWRSPIAGHVRIEAQVADAHPECGNGVTWSIEHRLPGERRVLASGEFGTAGKAGIPAIEDVSIRQGELISLLIGPRGDHSCDLTAVDLTITATGDAGRAWNLSRDVSGDILAGNPHADSLGNPSVWNFYHEVLAADGAAVASGIPRDSLLDRWRNEIGREVRDQLANEVEQLIVAGPPADPAHPNAMLHRQLTSFQGPLLGAIDLSQFADEAANASPQTTADAYGLPPERFGRHPTGGAVGPANLIVQAPSEVEIRLPGDLLAGWEFIATAAIDERSVPDALLQAQATTGQAAGESGLASNQPLMARPGSPAEARALASFDDFRAVFPAALCYAQIVPVDEVVTVALYHREDESLSRLMLDEAGQQALNRLWDELWYVSREALKVEVGYVQFMEYVTQDGDVRLFEPLRQPIADRAAAYRQQLLDTEPVQLAALVDFAARAWRRPLTDREASDLRGLYVNLRGQDLDHETAFRLTLARVLMAPSFLYKAEQPATASDSAPVTDWELASRLSYFLWSSLPDNELRELAAGGSLHDPAVLTAQMRRMLDDPRVRALADEFACQWIGVRGFDTFDEKSPEAFPEFAGLRGPMHEEAVRFFVNLFARNGSVLEILDADHAFLNEALARHYGIEEVSGPDWRRVDGMRARDRGGILGMAATLSKQSGASRTSPILRGNWLVETVLGEKLPKPPANVPQLPESDLASNLSMREITERHVAVESCAKCHVRIDPFGFALEGFDAIGRRRTTDLAGRPIDTQAQLRDGTQFTDIAGLRKYLLGQRRDDFVRQFCRKLLGYALGRGVQLSDEPLLAEMRQRLKEDDFRVQTAIEAIVHSQQFRYIRGTTIE